MLEKLLDQSSVVSHHKLVERCVVNPFSSNGMDCLRVNLSNPNQTVIKS